MLERRVVIRNRLGLHARAAARLVRVANSYHSAVRLERIDGSHSADAKSILSVLMLAAGFGTELRAIVYGEDEDEAINALCTLIAEGLGEEGRQ
ncbi:MAG: HPr family phosphocarrier protein [Pyrinomonadaceae bacterium]|nr:HPr family phosphocarrier protein [Pyrinomonadaceae bacterium]